MKVKGVVHCKKEPFDIYIGRPSKWGNPFVLTDELDREIVLAQYGSYILDKPFLLADLGELDGLVLGCWCPPKRCHGDILAELVELVA